MCHMSLQCIFLSMLVISSHMIRVFPDHNSTILNWQNYPQKIKFRFSLVKSLNGQKGLLTLPLTWHASIKHSMKARWKILRTHPSIPKTELLQYLKSTLVTNWSSTLPVFNDNFHPIYFVFNVFIKFSRRS
jgi:hypothetical protein